MKRNSPDYYDEDFYLQHVEQVVSERGVEMLYGVEERSRLYIPKWAYCPKLIRRLLELGVDPNSRGSDGDTLLIHAVRMDLTEEARMLLEAGADARVTGFCGLEPWYGSYGEDRATRVLLMKWGGYCRPLRPDRRDPPYVQNRRILLALCVPIDLPGRWRADYLSRDLVRILSTFLVL